MDSIYALRKKNIYASKEQARQQQYSTLTEIWFFSFHDCYNGANMIYVPVNDTVLR